MPLTLAYQHLFYKSARQLNIANATKPKPMASASTFVKRRFNTFDSDEIHVAPSSNAPGTIIIKLFPKTLL
jgi:hypothetical protein